MSVETGLKVPFVYQFMQALEELKFQIEQLEYIDDVPYDVLQEIMLGDDFNRGTLARRYHQAQLMSIDLEDLVEQIEQWKGEAEG